MKRAYDLIQQLDLALEQLRVGSPVTARFALILIENVVELVVHTSCEYEVMLDGRFDGNLLDAKYHEKPRKAILGQHFDAKVKFSRNLGMVTAAESRSILIIHSYRNELYHTGVRYDPIILPLAIQYLGITAGLLPKMRVIAWQLIAAESERVQKYLCCDPLWGWNGDGFIRVGEAIRAAAPSNARPLAEQLADFALSLVEDVERDLEFLV